MSVDLQARVDYLPVAVRAFTELADPSPDPPSPVVDEPESRPADDDRSGERPEVRGRRDRKARLRAYRRSARRERTSKLPRWVVVLDTETTIDAAQQLNFGSARIYHSSTTADGEAEPLRCVEEVLFYADNLPGRDPAGFAILREHAETTASSADWTAGGSRLVTLMSRSEFVERVIYRYWFERKATLVGFNLAFDLSRLAVRVRETRVKDFVGGYTLELFSWNDEPNLYRPTIRVRRFDNKKGLMAAGSPKFLSDSLEPDDQENPKGWKAGELLDLRQLAFALTSRGFSLASAGKHFNVPVQKTTANEHGAITAEYVNYCRNDVASTFGLYQALIAELNTHPISLEPSKAFSSATVAKSYLKTIGVVPILERQTFPVEQLGYAISAFYGGRAECHIRHKVMPVEQVDFTSMYPTVDALMGLWDVLTARTVQVVDATRSVQKLLDNITLEDCFNKDVWKELVGYALIIPDDDLLPVRAAYGNGPEYTIGINYLNGTTLDNKRVPFWFTIADLVAAKILSGKAPVVEQAYRIVGKGRLDNLQKVKLRGDLEIDPNCEDFFTAVIEGRHHVGKNSTTGGFLKVLANSGSYGIFAQMDSTEALGGKSLDVACWGSTGLPWHRYMKRAEKPGRYCFPPIAACITGAARLMLGMLERCVTDQGGSWVMCDTDSMAIVANETGCLIECPGGSARTVDDKPAIRALTHEQVESIKGRFGGLNPYDPDIIPDLLKTEAVGLCWAISAKRYTIFSKDEQGTVIVNAEKASEHGLGHLLDPTRSQALEFDGNSPVTNGKKRWVVNVWEWVLRRDAYGEKLEPLPFFDLPALSQFSVSSTTIGRVFRHYNDGRAYEDQIKPFNFLIGAHPQPALLDGSSMLSEAEVKRRSRLRLVAPFETDSDKWLSSPWFNLYQRTDNSNYQIEVKPDPLKPIMNRNVVMCEDYYRVVTKFRRLPEGKYNGPDGEVCNGRTVGELSRRRVGVLRLVHIGKEANNLDADQAQLQNPDEQTVVVYREQDHETGIYLRALSHLTAIQIAERLGVGFEAVNDWRSGDRRPDARNRAKLATLAYQEKHVSENIPNHLALLIWETLGTTCRLENCEKPVTGRSIYCCENHRKEASRRNRKAPAHA